MQIWVRSLRKVRQPWPSYYTDWATPSSYALQHKYTSDTEVVIFYSASFSYFEETVDQGISQEKFFGHRLLKYFLNNLHWMIILWTQKY
jgi:hypothetical protein